MTNCSILKMLVWGAKKHFTFKTHLGTFLRPFLKLILNLYDFFIQNRWVILIFLDQHFSHKAFLTPYTYHRGRIFRDNEKHLLQVWCAFVQRTRIYNYFFCIPSSCFWKLKNSVYLESLFKCINVSVCVCTYVWNMCLCVCV